MLLGGHGQILISTVLLIYDTFLTLPDEIEYIWKRNFRLAAAFYLIADYEYIIYGMGYAIVIILAIPQKVLGFLLFNLYSTDILHLFIYLFCQGGESAARHPSLSLQVVWGSWCPLSLSRSTLFHGKHSMLMFQPKTMHDHHTFHWLCVGEYNIKLYNCFKVKNILTVFYSVLLMAGAWAVCNQSWMVPESLGIFASLSVVMRAVMMSMF